jgi:hypothetical protein
LFGFNKAITLQNFRKSAQGGSNRPFLSMQQSVWRSRAWILQEKVSAKRIVYFTHSSGNQKGQTFWPCAERIWSEDGTETKVVGKNPLALDTNYRKGIGQNILQLLRRTFFQYSGSP